MSGLLEYSWKILELHLGIMGDLVHWARGGVSHIAEDGEHHTSAEDAVGSNHDGVVCDDDDDGDGDDGQRRKTW